MADFFFKTAVGDEGDYIIRGPNWFVNWDAGRVTSKIVAAAAAAIDEANEAAAQQARETHPWENRTFQTEESVIVYPSHLNKAEKQVWGSWGILDFPREPPRMNEPTNPAYEAEYGGRLLSTKDVALLLEFGFTTQVGFGSNRRPGQFVQFPWLYPAWDAEKKTVKDRFEAIYRSMGKPRDTPPRRVFLEPAWPGAKVGRSTLGTFLPLGPYFKRNPGTGQFE